MNTYEFCVEHPHKAAKKLQRLEGRITEQAATIAKLEEAARKLVDGVYCYDAHHGTAVNEKDFDALAALVKLE